MFDAQSQSWISAFFSDIRFFEAETESYILDKPVDDRHNADMSPLRLILITQHHDERMAFFHQVML